MEKQKEEGEKNTGWKPRKRRKIQREQRKPKEKKKKGKTAGAQ